MPLRDPTTRTTEQVDSAADTAQNQFRKALGATLVGIALLVVAIAVTWFAPISTTPSTPICILQDGRKLAELSPSAIVKATETGITIGPCPKVAS